MTHGHNFMNIPFLHNSNFVQLYFFTVVYEHRSRLEKILQKEKNDHKKTKEGK